MTVTTAPPSAGWLLAGPGEPDLISEQTQQLSSHPAVIPPLFIWGPPRLAEALRVWRCGLGLRADTAGQGSVHPVLPTPGPMGSFPAPWRTADPLATETTATSRAATVTAPSQPSGTSLSWGLPPPALFCLLPPRGLRSRQGLSDARQTWDPARDPATFLGSAPSPASAGKMPCLVGPEVPGGWGWQPGPNQKTPAP